MTSNAPRVSNPKPNVEAGVEYWRGVPATVDGVLGGYGKGTLPRVDSQGSRTFLLRVLPRLSLVTPPGQQQQSETAGQGQNKRRASKALDCGAGVGRVSNDVLTHIMDEVHLVEPAENLLEEAARSAPSWSTIKQAASNGSARSVHFHLSTLQDFDPSAYTSSTEAHEAVHGAGTPFTTEERGEKFDVIWAQWCLQHLSDADLVTFFKRAKASLVPASNDGADATSAKNAVLSGAGCIFVKENVAQDDGVDEYVWYDEEDKSITRSTLAYERVFREAGLEIVRCEVQLGLPEELFAVKMWALQPK